MGLSWKSVGQGYGELIQSLCNWLEEITGFHTVSLQPNSGSNGEYTTHMCTAMAST